MTTSTEELSRPRRERASARHPWMLPTAGLLLVGAAVALQVAGILQAGAGNAERATLLAWLAIGVSVVAFMVGLASVIRRRAWRLGLLVLVGALLANPYLLVRLLGLFG